VGGIEELSAILIRLAMPNHAAAVELVIGQPQCGLWWSGEHDLAA